VGLVEHVTFHNAENGFRVLRVKARGHRELVTAVGPRRWRVDHRVGRVGNDRTHGEHLRRCRRSRRVVCAWDESTLDALWPQE
jgi:hypothetical protein